MMKKRLQISFTAFRTICKELLAGLLFFALPIIVPAQSLSELPVASNIRTGTMDSGINYYLVKNSTEKNRVDIALVQKVGKRDENNNTRAFTTVEARSSLTDIPHFITTTPLSFMTENGIWPGPEGFVKVGEDATVYLFRDIDVYLKPNAVDSTLLMIFDIIDRDASLMKDYYSPQNQAIIISGDLDDALVLGKMFMLSMLVAKRDAELPVRKEQTPTRRNAVLKVGDQPSPLTSSFVVDYAFPRPPRENMNTLQPLVTRKFANELGLIIRKRVRTALRDEGVTVGDVHWTYVPSSSGPGDEHLRLSVVTTPKDIELATKITARTLAELDMYGALQQEYEDACSENIMTMRTTYQGDALPNRTYIEKCTSAFLYGSSLASSADELSFFTKRNLDGDTSLDLFNNFAQAALDREANLTFEAMANPKTASSLLETFDKEWSESVLATRKFDQYVQEDKDTVLMKKNLPKVKVAIDNPEPLSGGKMWTFSNGIKVVFKQVKTGSEGMFHYTWLLKSGYSWVKNLEMGEGAYISDMLWQSAFSGLSSNTFRNILTANGIDLESEVSISDFQLKGYAPTSKLDLLMKALLSLANERTIDQHAFETYRRNELLRRDIGKGGLEYRKAMLDSLMTPTSEFSPYKKPIIIKDDFKERCEALFERVFSKMNDGVLIIVGDFNEDALQKALCQYMGGFRTDKVATYRTRTRHFAIQGQSIKHDVGKAPSLDICASIPLTYTVDNLLAANIVSYLIEDVVGTEIAKVGWHLESDFTMKMFPEERYFLSMYMDPSDQDGLPATTLRVDDVDKMMEVVHIAWEKLSREGIDQTTLDNAKKLVSGYVTSWNSSPAMIIEFLILRYSYGKDLMSEQAAKVKAVSLETVNKILSDMLTSSLAEYAVREGNVVEDYSFADAYPEYKIETTTTLPAVMNYSEIGGLYLELFEGIKGADKSKDSWWDVSMIQRRSPVRRMPFALPKPEQGKASADEEVVIEEDPPHESASEVVIEEEEATVETEGEE